jgi:hypothetical protein
MPIDPLLGLIVWEVFRMARLACFVNFTSNIGKRFDVFAFAALSPAVPTCEQRCKLRDGTRLLRDRSQDASPYQPTGVHPGRKERP